MVETRVRTAPVSWRVVEETASVPVASPTTPYFSSRLPLRRERRHCGPENRNEEEVSETTPRRGTKVVQSLQNQHIVLQCTLQKEKETLITHPPRMSDSGPSPVDPFSHHLYSPRTLSP